MFQSLFQWIPVLYIKLRYDLLNRQESFNPYFSGFRSYTKYDPAVVPVEPFVSILISVDSGLIPYICHICSTLFTRFNPYFSGFRSYTGGLGGMSS